MQKVLTSKSLSITENQPGVNFINILQAAFARGNPESAKKINNMTVFFAPLGSAHVKVFLNHAHHFVRNLFTQQIWEEDGSEDEDVCPRRDARQPERVQDVGHGCAPPSGAGQDDDNDNEALKI